jgi:hypothetical protein
VREGEGRPVPAIRWWLEEEVMVVLVTI